MSRQPFGTHESFKIANDMIDKVENAAGVVERISAFSMGGSDAWDLAKTRGIDATIFDAPLHLRQVLSNTLATSPNTASVELVRNPENFIRIGSALRNVSLNPQ